jgi:hypothetical protein
MLAAATLAQAAAISFSGTFVNDNDTRSFQFQTLGGSVTIETFGYAGGTDANGNVIPRGGFDPIFGVFNFATGALIAIGDKGAVRVDPLSGAAFDALLTVLLPSGAYRLVIAQFNNFPIGPNLSNGFLQAGNATFTASFGCSNGKFCDPVKFNRTGNFDVSVSGVQVIGAAAPEPGSLALLAVSFSALWLARRRRSAT